MLILQKDSRVRLYEVPADGVCYKEHCLVEFDLEQAEILSFVET